MKIFVWFRHHWILSIILLLVLVIRIAIPPILLTKINEGLDKRSPIYSAHVNDLDLSFLRMAYRFEGIELKQKATSRVFMSAQAIDVSLAWRELIKGRVNTDIDVQFVDLDSDKGLALFAADNKEQAKTDAQAVKEGLFPVDVDRIKIRQSKVSFRPLPGSTIEETWRISDLDATATNLTPTDANPITLFLGTGTLLDSSKVKFAGQALLNEKPIDWKVDADLKGFDLTSANPILAQLVPITFKSGSLEMQSEVRSEKGTILGYVRPFAKKLEFVGDRGDFKGVGHFFLEIFAEFFNFVGKSSETHSIATQIDFGTIDGKMKVNTAKAIKLALEHSFVKELKPKTEDSLELTPKENKK